MAVREIRIFQARHSILHFVMHLLPLPFLSTIWTKYRVKSIVDLRKHHPLSIAESFLLDVNSAGIHLCENEVLSTQVR